MHACVLSCFNRVWLSATLQIIAHQAPGSMGISKQQYWDELPCPPPGDPPDPGTEPTSLTIPALTGGFFTTSASWEAPYVGTNKLYFIQTYLPLPQMYELWALNPFSLPGLPFPAYQKSIVILQTKDFKYQKLYEITPLILPCQIRCELSPLWIWIQYDSDSFNIIY